jgi:hypothetical protein
MDTRPTQRTIWVQKYLLAHGLSHAHSFLSHKASPHHAGTTNLKVYAHNHIIIHTHTPLRHITEHGAILTSATSDGVDFLLHTKHTSLTHIQFTHKQESMWGFHNNHLLAHNPTLCCPMCGQFTINGHMAGN